MSIDLITGIINGYRELIAKAAMRGEETIHLEIEMEYWIYERAVACRQELTI